MPCLFCSFLFAKFGNPIIINLKKIGEKKDCCGGTKKKGGVCPKATWSQLGEG
jgi:hypothetical protein